MKFFVENSHLIFTGIMILGVIFGILYSKNEIEDSTF